MAKRHPNWMRWLVVLVLVAGCVFWVGDRRKREQILFDVAAIGTAEQVRSLLSTGLSPNARDRRASTQTPRSSGVYWSTRWRTPLHYAAETGSVELLRALIQAGARVNVTALDGHTPLMLAVEWQELGPVRELLAAGARVNVRERQKGLTALHIAAARGDTELLRTLLDAGAEVDAANVQGATPLCLALEQRNSAAARLLLDRGATVHVRGTAPPLFIAAQNRDLEMVRLLLSRGADPGEIRFEPSAGQGARSGTYGQAVQLIEAAQRKWGKRARVAASQRPAPWKVPPRGLTHWEEAAEEMSVTVALPLALGVLNVWLLVRLWCADGLRRLRPIEGWLPLRGRWLRILLTALLVLAAIPLMTYNGLLAANFWNSLGHPR